MALQRLKDQGGFNGDRIESCAMPTVFASGSDWLRTVVEKSDLAEGNLAGTRIRETTFAHTALRKARLRGARLERVELYFCDLNELDAGQISARRVKIHGCEAMNAVFSGAQIAVARFEDTKLYRARFDGALIVRTAFADARPLMPMKFRSCIQHRLTRAAEDRWALMPHAYAFVDPLFSTGIAWRHGRVEYLEAKRSRF